MIYRISTMNWQNSLNPIDFYLENSSKLRNGSTILISASTSELHTFLKNTAHSFNHLNLMYYRASDSLSKSRPPSLLKRLFFIETLDIMETAKREQSARKLIRHIQQNDAAINDLNQQLKREIVII
jgi:4'-phosphopantetheinyl transferase EntD